MRSLVYLLPLLHLILAQNTGINVADVPLCARDCLSNSTSVVADTCASLNVACLCNSPVFVSTFYCCLSTQCDTSEQATAITFNQQQCAAVNTTAPDFVGCSPLKATSTAGGVKSATTVTPVNDGPASTIASIVSELANFSVTNQVTVTFSGQPILTGSCSAPIFALISTPNNAQLFPQVGCAPNREDCCPFDSGTNAVLTQCPQDYFTTANGCCPSGYQMYSTNLGAETPCYSTVSTTLVPATTPSISGLVVITNQVFSKRYDLASTNGSGLSAGAIAGITIVSVALIIIPVLIMWWIKRRNTTRAIETGKIGITFPPEEPVLPPQQDAASPQELASPEVVGYKSPIRSFWPIGHFSPSSVHVREKPLPVAKSFSPQELPGSTYMNEHHPAFPGSDTATQLSATDTNPRTPTMSPAISRIGSPVVTPGPEEHEPRTLSPATISPIGSPRLPRTITDQSINSDR